MACSVLAIQPLGKIRLGDFALLQLLRSKGRLIYGRQPEGAWRTEMADLSATSSHLNSFMPDYLAMACVVDCWVAQLWQLNPYRKNGVVLSLAFLYTCQSSAFT